MTADDTSRDALIERLRGPLANVLCNASNFPDKAQVHILGADMRPLMDKAAAAVVDAVVMPLVEAHDQEVSEALSERDVVILGVLRLIGDLDDARVSGGNYTYEEIQRRLRLCIDGNDPECDHVYRVFREVSGGTCIKCTECGELLSRDGK